MHRKDFMNGLMLILMLSFCSFCNAAEKGGLSYRQVAHDIKKKCDSPSDSESTGEQRAEAREQSECVKRQLVKELDTVLLPLKSTQKDRFSLLMKQQAQWNRFIDGCDLMEQVHLMLDQYTGAGLMEDHGVYVGEGDSHCQGEAALQRIVFVRALKSQEPSAFINEINEQQDVGTKLKGKLSKFKETVQAELKKSVAAKAPSPEDSHSEAPLGAEKLKAYLEYVKQIEGDSSALAKSVCEYWKEVSTGLGGVSTCTEKLGTYLFAAMKKYD